MAFEKAKHNTPKATIKLFMSGNNRLTIQIKNVYKHLTLRTALNVQNSSLKIVYKTFIEPEKKHTLIDGISHLPNGSLARLS